VKRFSSLVVLMALSSSAHAGGFSFVVGGHRIRIDAPRYCGSPSCVSVSIPGIYETRRRRERNDEIDAAPANPPAPQLALAPSAVTPPGQTSASQPPVEPRVAAPPAPAPKEAVAPTPPPLPIEPVTPSVTPPPLPAADVVAPAVLAAPQVLKISREADEPPAETPLGDWRTEGDKGSVRIEQCGPALCGYVLDRSSNVLGESVLINMKPKAGDQWSGNIYSRASGATYYGTVAMNGANSLRVEACVLGRFFCSANIWSRIVGKPQGLITSRQTSPAPRS
jgi:uncharacterized protein (DUF2147 family)